MEEAVKIHIFLLLAINCILFLGFSCGESKPSPTTLPAMTISPTTTPPQTTTPLTTPVSFEVEINGDTFIPANITVPVGATVTWIHRDREADSAFWFHNVTSETGLFDSGLLAFGDTFSYTFTERGTFNYYNKEFPYRRGKVIVG